MLLQSQKSLLRTLFQTQLITSYYFFSNFSSPLHILPFETELGTSEGILRKMYASLSCLRSKSDYRFRPEGPVWEDLLQSLFTCWKKTEERWRKAGTSVSSSLIVGKKGKLHHKTQTCSRVYLSMSMWADGLQHFTNIIIYTVKLLNNMHLTQIV